MYNTSHLLESKSHANPGEMRKELDFTTNPVDVKAIVAQSADQTPVVGMLGGNIHDSIRGKSDVYTLTIGFDDVDGRQIDAILSKASGEYTQGPWRILQDNSLQISHRV